MLTVLLREIPHTRSTLFRTISILPKGVLWFVYFLEVIFLYAGLPMVWFKYIKMCLSYCYNLWTLWCASIIIITKQTITSYLEFAEYKPPLGQSRNIHSSSVIVPPCKTQQRQHLISPVRYLTGTGVHDIKDETFKAAVCSI